MRVTAVTLLVVALLSLMVSGMRTRVPAETVALSPGDGDAVSKASIGECRVCTMRRRRGERLMEESK